MPGPTATSMVPAPYRVERIHRETHDVFTLELVPVAGTPRISFLPGQFTMLHRFGTGEVPICVSGSSDYHALVHTIRAVDSVTEQLAELTRGNVLDVRGPFGSHWPLEQAKGKDVMVVAGGLGLASVRPIIYHVLENRDDFGRFFLFYGTRSPEDILYRYELERWRSHLDLEIQLTVDHAGPSWHGNVGVVTNLVSRVPFDPDNAVAMVCGPEVMMRFAVLNLERLGMGSENIYVSMERSMKCAVGRCCHCQDDSHVILKEGPVFRFDVIESVCGTRKI